MFLYFYSPRFLALSPYLSKSDFRVFSAFFPFILIIPLFSVGISRVAMEDLFGFSVLLFVAGDPEAPSVYLFSTSPFFLSLGFCPTSCRDSS